jgi:hypothetical protein
MIVKLIKKTGDDGRVLSLTINREYEVLGIEADNYRILDDENKLPYGNDPVLFEPECFKIIDSTEPDFWVCCFGEEEERYCYPIEWNRIGFFEDYHDGNELVKKIFWDGLRKYYPKTYFERFEY